MRNCWRNSADKAELHQTPRECVLAFVAWFVPVFPYCENTWIILSRHYTNGVKYTETHLPFAMCSLNFSFVVDSIQIARAAGVLLGLLNNSAVSPFTSVPVAAESTKCFSKCLALRWRRPAFVFFLFHSQSPDQLESRHRNTARSHGRSPGRGWSRRDGVAWGLVHRDKKRTGVSLLSKNSRKTIYLLFVLFRASSVDSEPFRPVFVVELSVVPRIRQELFETLEVILPFWFIMNTSIQSKLNNYTPGLPAAPWTKKPANWRFIKSDKAFQVDWFCQRVPRDWP